MLIKRIIFLAALAIVLFSSVPENIFAQTGVSLETEIQNIEREITRRGITAVERHDALVRLARLRQLSGDIEGAAKNWLEAAAAIPGRIDDDALLACAYCLAAMGEWDRATAALEQLLQRSARARFLDNSIRAINSGDLSELGSLVDNPVYAEMKAEILFVLWKVSRGTSAERWRQRLVNEFPHTLEGRLATGESSTIIVRPSPFWLFAGGLDSLPLVAAQVPTVQTPAAQAQTAVPQTQSARLQTGLFSRQANAQTQAANLRRAGFSPSIEQRTVNNNEMWAVTVPAGSDQTRTANELRAAGFESFLIR